MNRVAVGADCGAANSSVLVDEIVRLLLGRRAALDSFLEGQVRIFDVQGDIAHTIAVAAKMLAGRAAGVQGRGQQDVGLALTQQIGSSLPVPGFEPAVCNLRKTECVAIVERRLFGVADIELNVMDSLQL